MNFDTLKCCVWNVRGLGDKMSDPLFTEKIKDYDIIGLLETKLANNHDIQLQNYNFVQSPCRKQISGGGVGILIKDSLKDKIQIIKNTHSEYMWVKIDSHASQLEHDVYVCFCYIAPENSAYSKHTDNDILSLIDDDILYFNAIGQVVLCGDLNGHISNEPDYIPKYSFEPDGS